MTVKIKGIGWAVVRTAKWREMAKFYQEVFGLESAHERPNGYNFRLPNGDTIEGVEPPEENPFVTGPIPGFEVDDVASARAEMEQAGVKFVGPIRGGPPISTWSHYYAPDGNIYCIWDRGENG